MNLEKIKTFCALYLEDYFDFNIIVQVDNHTSNSVSICYLCMTKTPAKMTQCNHSEKIFLELLMSEDEEYVDDYRLRIKCSQLKYMSNYAEIAFVFSCK